MLSRVILLGAMASAVAQLPACGRAGAPEPIGAPRASEPAPTADGGDQADPPAEPFPLGCHRVERPAAEKEGPPSATLCFQEDRFVMWGHDMHESRYIAWTERSDEVWSGVSPGDYSRTLEVRVERRAEGDVFIMGGQEAPLRHLDADARHRAERERAALPTIEEVCEPAHRCLAAADAARSKATGETPTEPLVFGKSVVECQIQMVLALRMIPEGTEIPEDCRPATVSPPDPDTTREP